MSSLCVGIVRLVLDFTYQAPLCGIGEDDLRPSIVSKIEFLHFSTILSAFALIVMVGISLVTKPRAEHKVYYIVKSMIKKSQVYVVFNDLKLTVHRFFVHF